MTKKRVIIAARAKRDSGKTTAIREAWTWLKEQGAEVIKEEIHEYHDPQKQDDVTAVLEYQGIQIGISSWGDPGIDQQEILNGFIQTGCRVIVCACRTKWSTKEPIDALQESWCIRYVVRAEDGYIPKDAFLNEVKKVIQKVKPGKI